MVYEPRYQNTEKSLQKMVPVVFQFVNRFVQVAGRVCIWRLLKAL